MKGLIHLVFQAVIWIVYVTYKAEGLNALLLLLPAKLITPLLIRHGASIGEGVEMHSPLIIHNASSIPGQHYANLQIGKNCYFGRDVFFDLKNVIQIKDEATVSMRVTFITHTDVGKGPLKEQIPPNQGPILIGSGAYVGAGATILQGVEIGAGAVVGAGALVNRSVPHGARVAGVPARLI